MVKPACGGLKMKAAALPVKQGRRFYLYPELNQGLGNSEALMGSEERFP